MTWSWSSTLTHGAAPLPPLHALRGPHSVLHPFMLPFTLLLLPTPVVYMGWSGHVATIPWLYTRGLSHQGKNKDRYKNLNTCDSLFLAWKQHPCAGSTGTSAGDDLCWFAEFADISRPESFLLHLLKTLLFLGCFSCDVIGGFFFFLFSFCTTSLFPADVSSRVCGGARDFLGPVCVCVCVPV